MPLSLRNSIEHIIKNVEKYYKWMVIRLLSAVVFALSLFYYLSTKEDMFDMEYLKKVFLFHHLCACLGVDEAMSFNFTTTNFFFKRMITRYNETTSLFASYLPNKRTKIWIIAYIVYIIHLLYILLTATSKLHINVSISLFFILSIFDIGLFLSTRPGDIFKFIILMNVQNTNLNVIQSLIYSLSALYFWSGLSKFQKYFWSFVFQYTFLLCSPIGFLLRNLYLDKTNGLRPTLFSKIFGFCGVIIEFIGALMLLFDESLFYGICVMTMMHSFIFIFGIGPYRWNVIFVYMLWTLYANKNRLKENENGNGLFLIVYVVIFGICIPLIGYFDPHTLGKYFGGYRMASFHFTGNETQIGLFIHKDLIRDCKQDNLMTRYLKDELKKHSNGDENRLGFISSCDGLNVFALPKHECFIDENYFFISLFMLSINIGLLNTKFDDSLMMITDRYCQQIVDELNLVDKKQVFVLKVWSNPYWSIRQRKVTVKDIIYRE